MNGGYHVHGVPSCRLGLPINVSDRSQPSPCPNVDGFNSSHHVRHISAGESITCLQSGQLKGEIQPSLTDESSYSGKTATNSPFASGLTTPNDEEPRHSLFSPVIEDQTPKQLGSFVSQKQVRKGPLSRVVYKAREAARSVLETPKRLRKVRECNRFPALFFIIG